MIHWFQHALRLLMFSGICTGTYARAQQLPLPNIGATQAEATSAGPLANVSGLMAATNFKGAEDALRSYLLIYPRSAQAHYMLAYSLLRQNRPKDSLEEYTRAAALVTPSAEQLRYVGQDYVLLGDYQDAEMWMLRSVQMDPADAENWYGLGRLRYSEQRYPEAADCFKRALGLAPESVKIENNLGLAYEGLNRMEEAVAAYRQAIAWQNADVQAKASEQPLLNLAIVLIHQAKAADALPLLQRVLTIAPHDPRALEELGKLYLQQKNYAEAEKCLEEAVQLDTEKSNLHFLLGQTYRHLGRQQDAKDEFARASGSVSSDTHK